MSLQKLQNKRKDNFDIKNKIELKYLLEMKFNTNYWNISEKHKNKIIRLYSPEYIQIYWSFYKKQLYFDIAIEYSFEKKSYIITNLFDFRSKELDSMKIFATNQKIENFKKFIQIIWWDKDYTNISDKNILQYIYHNIIYRLPNQIFQQRKDFHFRFKNFFKKSTLTYEEKTKLKDEIIDINIKTFEDFINSIPKSKYSLSILIVQWFLEFETKEQVFEFLSNFFRYKSIL